MKLLDLDPLWLEQDGRKVGFVFRSPVKQDWWQSCFFAPTKMGVQMRLLAAALPAEETGGRIQPCDQKMGWDVQGEFDFATLTVSPSLDGSKGGLWHGFIQKGQIVGGGI